MRRHHISSGLSVHLAVCLEEHFGPEPRYLLSKRESGKIFPAGPFQASRNMFRAYFIQIEPSSMRESSLADVLIFAKPIAKRLNITRRFVGDERHNPKMQFYNDLAKEIMPQYGIEVVEIPRAQVKGRAISASLTRSAAVEGDRETLLENVPETTLKFLIGEE